MIRQTTIDNNELQVKLSNDAYVYLSFQDDRIHVHLGGPSTWNSKVVARATAANEAEILYGSKGEPNQ